MPYLESGVRASLAEGRVPTKGGELNYLITKLVDSFLMGKGLSYASINEAMGALECAKLELYRRIAAPYEDKKVIENGDAYTAQFHA